MTKRLVCIVASVTALLATPGQAATIYIGDAAAEGQSVTANNGNRADSVGTLTYVLHANYYTATSDEQLKLTEVNFYADASGTLTPFVALYNGGDSQQAASYTILSKGDALSVTVTPSVRNDGIAQLENQAFTVGGSNPTINVSAGDTIAAGWLQVGNIVYLSNFAQGTADYIRGGDSLSGASVGESLTADSNYSFDRTMQLNIGFQVVPEPSTFVLAALGLVGLIGCGRRRKR
jgi:hypothetical protein